MFLCTQLLSGFVESTAKSSEYPLPVKIIFIPFYLPLFALAILVDVCVLPFSLVSRLSLGSKEKAGK